MKGEESTELITQAVFDTGHYGIVRAVQNKVTFVIETFNPPLSVFVYFTNQTQIVHLVF